MPPKASKVDRRKSKGQQVAEHSEEVVAEGSTPETCKFQVMFNLTYLILLQGMLFSLVTWSLFFLSPSAGKVDRRKSKRQHAAGDSEEVVAERSSPETCKFQVMFNLTYLILLQGMLFSLVTWSLFLFPLL